MRIPKTAGPLHRPLADLPVFQRGPAGGVEFAGGGAGSQGLALLHAERFEVLRDAHVVFSCPMVVKPNGVAVTPGRLQV